MKFSIAYYALSPHEINVAEHLAMAKQLRAKTANYLLNVEEIDKAKSEGRPWLSQTRIPLPISTSTAKNPLKQNNS